jgi:tyrosyl-tRNA synthetase
MATELTADQRYELITRRLGEVLGGDQVKAILAEGRSPKCYWGAFIIVRTMQGRQR